MNMYLDAKMLDTVAVDQKRLASNFPFAVPDCTGLDAEDPRRHGGEAGHAAV